MDIIIRNGIISLFIAARRDAAEEVFRAHPDRRAADRVDRPAHRPAARARVGRAHHRYLVVTVLRVFWTDEGSLGKLNSDTLTELNRALLLIQL